MLYLVLNIFFSFFFKYLGKVLIHLITLCIVIICRDWIWGGDFISDLTKLLNDFDLNTLMIHKEIIFLISCCTVLIRDVVTEIYNFIIKILLNILINENSLRLFNTIKVFFKITFTNLKLKIGIKSESENIIKIKKNILAKNSDSDTQSKPEDQQPNKGKGRALSSSDSEGEGESSKKRKLDKGKGKAIDLGLSSSLNEDKGSLIHRILDLKTSLDKAEEVEKRCIKDIEKSNNIDLITKLLAQKNEREKEIGELKIQIYKLLEEGKENNTDFDAEVDSASYERYKAYRDLYGTPPSRDSSRPVSSSGHSSNAEFPPYNPKDYESESENKGASSSKK